MFGLFNVNVVIEARVSMLIDKIDKWWYSKRFQWTVGSQRGGFALKSWQMKNMEDVKCV